MLGTGVRRSLLKSLQSWSRTDTVLLWAWALSVAAAVTVYEIYFNNQSQHPGDKFWADRVPGYFTMTLAFTGVTLGLSALSSHLKGWLGVLVVSISVSLLFAVLMPGSIDWWRRLLLGRNLVALTTLYLVPPYLMAILIHRRAG